MVLDEREAISLLHAGEIHGLEFLVASHQGKALKAAYLITRNKALAEDIVQEAFIRVFERSSQFDENRTFAPWFLKIVTNDAVKAVSRGRHSAQPSDLDAISLDVVADRALEPEQRAEDSELREMVWRAMQALSPAQRALIVQKYYLGLSEREMAASRGGSIGAVKQLLHRARVRLRTILTSAP